MGKIENAASKLISQRPLRLAKRMAAQVAPAAVKWLVISRLYVVCRAAVVKLERF